MKRQRPRSVFSICGLWLGLPLVFAEEPASAKPAQRHFTTGGSVAKAAAQMHSQLDLTTEQKSRVKQLLEQRAEALQRATGDLLQNHRAAMEAILRPEQARKLVWPQAFYWSDEIVATKISDLDAAQKGELPRLMQRRNAGMWSALNAAQERYEEELKWVLNSEQQARFAAAQAGKTINIEDRE